MLSDNVPAEHSRIKRYIVLHAAAKIHLGLNTGSKRTAAYVK